jgi:uracil-DNA glycosylase
VTDARSLARAYLEQQRLLGTDAVVLPEAGASAEPQLTPDSRPGLVTTNPTEGSLAPGVSPGSSDAPLPPPGISYDPPTGDLFSKDPIREAASLEAVAALVAECTKCRLCETRKRTVPGEGRSDARLVVVGEGPGRTEDETGRPFVGQAGDLLTKILAAIDLPRDQVYICNVVKCRPPENRTPQYDEIASCVPYLWRQIELLRPKVILAMGGTAAQTMLNAKSALGAMRNKIHRFRGIPLVVTYHPAALLRNPNWKKPTWDDVRIARRLLDA